MPPGYSSGPVGRYGRHDPICVGSKGVSAGASRYEEIEPESFVTGEEMSASALTAMRVSYVHAGIKVLHFSELAEVHRIIGTREDAVYFILQVLIASRVEEEMTKYGG